MGCSVFCPFERIPIVFSCIPMEEQVLACAAGQYYLTFEMEPDEFCRLYDRAGIWRNIFSDFYTERQVINGLDTAKEISVRKTRTH